MNGAAAPDVLTYQDSALWETIGPTLRPGGLELTGHALDICGFAPGARLLDVGCGLGATSAYLARLGFAVSGLEPSPVLLAEARRRCPEVELLSGRAEALPFADECFDGVFMECVLSLVADRRLALAEAARVLRVGGMLVVSDARLWSAAGAHEMEPASLEHLLRDCGLQLEGLEDHSRELVQLVARMVFAGISPASAAGLLGCGDGCGGLEPITAGATTSPSGTSLVRGGPGAAGYYLMVARRTADRRARGDWRQRAHSKTGSR